MVLSTGDVVAKHVNMYRACVCFVDANARVGECRPPITDDAFERTSTPNSVWFLDMLESCGLMLPVAHDRFAHASGWDGSFRPSTGGCRVPIDYVAVSTQIRVTPGSAATWGHFDIGLPKEDHVPVVLEISLMSTFSRGAVRKRIAGYDRLKVKDACCARHFASLISSPPLIPADVDVCSHLHMLSAFWRNCAAIAFPKQTFRIRKSWISEATGALIRYRSQLRKTATCAGRRVKTAAVFVVFRFWAHGCAPRFDMVYGFARKSDTLSAAYWFSVSGLLAVQIRSLLHMEYLAHLDHCADEASCVLGRADLSGAARIVRMLQPRSTRGARPRNAQGLSATSLAEEQRTFQEHFAALLGATSTRMESMILSQWRDPGRGPAADTIRPDMASVPSVAAVARRAVRSQQRKAIGGDLLGGELFAVDHWATAKAFHPLFAKAWMSIDVPIQFRGGMLVALRERVRQPRFLDTVTSPSLIMSARCLGAMFARP